MINKYVVQLDNTFALNNFKYVTEQVKNQRLTDVYHLLGPLDYSKYQEETDLL